jgi:hypothetical protein
MESDGDAGQLHIAVGNERRRVFLSLSTDNRDSCMCQGLVSDTALIGRFFLSLTSSPVPRCYESGRLNETFSMLSPLIVTTRGA